MPTGTPPDSLSSLLALGAPEDDELTRDVHDGRALDAQEADASSCDEQEDASEGTPCPPLLREITQGRDGVEWEDLGLFCGVAGHPQAEVSDEGALQGQLEAESIRRPLEAGPRL